MTVRGCRERPRSPIMGLMLTGEMDDNLVLDEAAATDAAGASRPVPAGVFFDRGPGCVRFSGRASCVDVHRVGS